MSREQELGLDRSRKKFDAREEYFVSLFFFLFSFSLSPLFHDVGMYVEAEFGESRGMGTETHRETERVTGMGCRTSAAAECIPNRPYRRLGGARAKKDLNDPRWRWFVYLPCFLRPRSASAPTPS